MSQIKWTPDTDPRYGPPWHNWYGPPPYVARRLSGRVTFPFSTPSPPPHDPWVRLCDLFPWYFYPLAGHSGSCAKVTGATVTGKTETRCTCGAGA